MAFRTDLDALVLGVLQGGVCHGYEITKRINALGETAFRVNEGQLYPILHRLENEGKVMAEWIPQEGKPARKTYALTQAGRKELDARRDAWNQFVAAVDSVLAVPVEVKVG
jgi:PadR family transcriptional regulator PadR